MLFIGVGESLGPDHTPSPLSTTVIHTFPHNRDVLYDKFSPRIQFCKRKKQNGVYGVGRIREQCTSVVPTLGSTSIPSLDFGIDVYGHEGKGIGINVLSNSFNSIGLSALWLIAGKLYCLLFGTTRSNREHLNNIDAEVATLRYGVYTLLVGPLSCFLPTVDVVPLQGLPD